MYMIDNNIHFKLLTDKNIDEYLTLLKCLSDTVEERDKILNLMTFYKIAEVHPFIQIWIMQDYYNKKMIGCGTIMIEPKFIHKCKNVAHIEDICILPEYQNKGYGNKLIQYLVDITKSYDCYKVILNCNENVKSFYEKCGFKETNIQMSIYF